MKYDDEGEGAGKDEGGEGEHEERRMLRLLVGSRVLRKRRIRRALLARLVREREAA